MKAGSPSAPTRLATWLHLARAQHIVGTVRGEVRRLLLDHAPGLVRSARHLLGRGNFVMFHVGRSGSTILTSLLNQHRQIYCDGELLHGYYGAFDRRMQSEGANTRFLWNSSRYFPHDPIGFVKSRMPYAGLHAFYGFETKFFHLRFNNLTLPSFLDAVQQLGFGHFIVLERRNSLRKVVSSVVAHGRDQFHVRSGENASLSRITLDVNCVEIDSDSKPLIAYLEDYAENFHRLRELLAGHRVAWLTYEDDVLADPMRGYHRCCDFLQLEPGNPSVRLTRTNPFRLQDIVTNFQEVSRYLSGTPFDWMLEDDPA